MSKKPGWDWKYETRDIPCKRRPVADIASDMLAADKELRDAAAHPYSYGIKVGGFVRMSDPKELAVAKARQELAAKKRAKKIAKERPADLRTVARLAKKHGLQTLPETKPADEAR